jgi:hypothetical protein
MHQNIGAQAPEKDRVRTKTHARKRPKKTAFVQKRMRASASSRLRA